MGIVSMARAAVVGVLLAAAVAGGIFVAGCDSPEPARAAGPLRVVVTIPPLEGLAEALAPEGAEVKTLLPPGRSEHGYELTPSDMAALQRADVVVFVGLGLEPKVEAFLEAHPREDRRVVEFASVVGIEGEGHDHSHEHDGHEHAAEGVDPHLWLDPELVLKLIPELADALLKAGTEAGMEIDEFSFQKQVYLFKGYIDGAARVRWRDALAPFEGSTIVTHHAAWSRLADRYGLKVAAVIRPIEGQEPSPGQIEAAVRAIREQGARAVFVEPQFDATVAERIAEQAGVAVGTLDPLGHGDWFAMMEQNIQTLARLLGGEQNSTAPGGAGSGD